MISSTRRLRAAFLLPALAAIGVPIAFGGIASAQGNAVETPAYRRLGATETMSSPGTDGADYSANPSSLAGLSLLATIPKASVPRRGYFVQAQCTAGLAIALDDGAGSLTPTIIVLDGAAADGSQGGVLDMAAMPHTGRVRIFSSDAACRMAARSW